MTTAIHKKTWADKYKIPARQETVINQIKKFLDNKPIPKNKQYWTLCGRCDSPGTELDHVLKENIITCPSQFFGAEINKEIYDLNINAHLKANFFNCDLVSAMNKVRVESNFNPAIINIDTNHRTKESVLLTSKIIKFLKHINKNNVLIITNVVLKHIGKGNTFEDFIRELRTNNDFLYYGKDIEIGSKMFEYRNKATLMGTYYFAI